MRITWKFVALTVAVIASSILLLAWRNQAFLSSERTSELHATAETQSALLASLAREKTDFLSNQMIQFVYAKTAGRGQSLYAQQILSQFEVVSLLTVGDRKSWSARWMERSSQSVGSALPDPYLSALLASLPMASLDQSAPTWITIEDTQRQPLLALLKFVQLGRGDSAATTPALIVAIVNPTYLADAVKSFSGSSTIAALVDSDGHFLAHGDSQWVGQPQPDWLGPKLQRRQSLYFGIVKNENNRSHYLASERIDGTNLTALIATPLSNGGLANLQLLILGLGLLIAGALVSYGVARNWEQTLEQQPQPSPQPAAATAVDAPGPAPISRDELRRFAAGVAAEMRGPTLSVLGNSQILISQLGRGAIDSKELNLKVSAIDKEARRIKKTVDHLAMYSGLEGNQQQTVDLPTALETVLGRLEAELRGVQIEKRIDQVPQIQAQPQQIAMVCEEVIRNALEAMAGREQRLLQLTVDALGPVVRLKVRDNGVGMDNKMKAQIFEPFTTTQQDKHLGLGMATVRGILNAQGGCISVESQFGSGTEVIVEFSPDSQIPRVSPEAKPEAVSESERPELMKSKMRKDISFNKEDAPIPLTDEKLILSSPPAPAVKTPEFKVKIRRPKMRADV